MLVTFGDCRLDLARRELRVARAPVHLTPKAFDVLRFLVENRARAVSKTELFEHVWPGVFVSDDSLARAVAEIRGAIGDSARQARWLRTVHGYGYVFAAAPDEIADEPRLARYVLQCGSRQFALTAGQHLIGRDPASAIPMSSPAVSRRHASIQVTDTEAILQDLGSKNGTFIGDDRLDGPYVLREGDIVRVGDFSLVVTAVVGASTETVPL